MDLLDWFFSLSTAYNFCFSNEVIYNNLLRGHRVSSCHTFSLQGNGDINGNGNGNSKDDEEGDGDGEGNSNGNGDGMARVMATATMSMMMIIARKKMMARKTMAFVSVFLPNRQQ